MYRVFALLAVLGLFVFTSSADAAHQAARVKSDVVSSLLDAPIPAVANPTVVQLAGHCGGGYYGRPHYGYGGYGGYHQGYRHAYRPVWGYGGGYGGYYGGHRHHHHHHRYHGHHHGGFGLYIGF